MEETMKLLWMTIAFIIGLLHIVSPLLKEKEEKIISYVALALHVPLFLFLLLSKAKIEVVAIVITLSLLVYILANTIIPYVKKNMTTVGKAEPVDTDSCENISEEGENNDI